jgi:hypothetical protein
MTLHRINSQNVDTRYKDYDKRVIAFIKLIIEDLEFSYKNIPTSFIASFDLLANLLKLYFIAIDQLNDVKNPNDLAKCRNTILQTSNAINKIAASFGGSPVDKARIKRLNSTVDDSDELLDDLING